MKESLKFITQIITNRILILFVCIFVMFYILLARLFDLQIVNGYTYQNELKLTTLTELPLEASRGIIYDKYGRTLATNSSAFSIKIDPSVKIDPDEYNYNDVLYELIMLLEENGEVYTDDLPISKEEPFEFEFGTDTEKKREIAWKNNMSLQNSDNSYIDYSAEETFNILRKYFGISNDYSNVEARKILSLRTSMFMQRYVMYNPITVAIDVSAETVAVIREEGTRFPGIYIDVEPLREYPEGPYFSHIIGYTGKISSDELESLNADITEKYGDDENLGELLYSQTDIVGKTGLEKSMEYNLRGESGTSLIEVDNLRRPIRVVDMDDATKGQEIFLTIDKDLQTKTYEIIEDMLKDVLINKLKSSTAGKDRISQTDLFSSMITSNHIISIDKILNANKNTASYKVYEKIADEIENKETYEIRKIIASEIENSNISISEILLILIEQEIITADDFLIENLENRKVNTLDVIIEKIEMNEITPQMTNLDPSTASAIVIDVSSGSVLASVSYPTYDTNYLVNTIDANYLDLLYNDETRPLLNRTFVESRAPGSTFKMITAIAGLEEGVITENTEIYDEYTFTKAGYPHANCNSYHGTVNATTALEVSCNYFFFETAYRLGSSAEGNLSEGIDALNEYMVEFGLNERTGVEIGELADSVSSQMENVLSEVQDEELYLISSPQFKEFSTKRFSSEPDSVPKTDYEWRDGDTRNTSIGQAYNDYSVASMGKYMATIASRGERYELHLVDKTRDADGSHEEVKESVLENIVVLEDSTWNVVFSGMENVISGSRGTARSVFADFPIEVAGKTGTAEESTLRSSHNSFGCFAPIDNPQIAIYVSVPFGDTKVTSSPSATISREILSYYFGLENEPILKNMDNTLVP